MSSSYTIQVSQSHITAHFQGQCSLEKQNCKISKVFDMLYGSLGDVDARSGSLALIFLAFQGGQGSILIYRLRKTPQLLRHTKTPTPP